MTDLRTLLTPRRLFAIALIAIVTAGPIACSQFTGESSTRAECHKGRGLPEC